MPTNKPPNDLGQALNGLYGIFRSSDKQFMFCLYICQPHKTALRPNDATNYIWVVIYIDSKYFILPTK